MKLTLGKKLMGGFLVILLLLAGIVTLANFEMSRMNSMYQRILDEDIQEVNQIQDYKADVIEQSNAVYAYLLENNPQEKISFSAIDKSYNKLVNGEKDREGNVLLAKMHSARNEFIDIAKKEIEYKKENQVELYTSLATYNARSVSVRFQKAADAVVSYKQEKMQKDRMMIDKQMNQTRLMILLFSLCALAIGIIVSIVVSYVISRPVRRVSKTLMQVANGNLSVPEVPVKSKDEIADLAKSTNLLVENLKILIGNVYDSAAQVASSSQQLLASNEQNANAAEQIAKRVGQTTSGAEKQLELYKEVAASIQDMAAGIRQIAGSSERMLESSDGAIELIENGTMSVKTVVNHMNEINVSFEKASQIVTVLGQRSQEINGIAGLITEIANQTNLLALNAAIEAARAGEHGKGFAVVADEVRKLAVQSKKSADQIAVMIGVIQAEIKQAIEAVESGNQLVDQGLASSDDANAAFSKITCSIEGVSKNIQDVSAAVEELTAQSHIIVDTIDHVEAIAREGLAANHESAAATEEQVATAEEVTSSAQGLTRLADEMKATIGKFKV